MTEIAQHTGLMEALTVGQVAETFGVTVRTLHHYDEVGLLHPNERTPAGYRLYTGEDLQRLSTIVVYRRLDFSLEEIGELLDADGAEVIDHLRRQPDEVRARLAQMSDLVDAIDRRLEAAMTDRPATTEDLKELFGDGYGEEYQAEAQERWGQTPQWEQSPSLEVTEQRDPENVTEVRPDTVDDVVPPEPVQQDNTLDDEDRPADHEDQGAEHALLLPLDAALGEVGADAGGEGFVDGHGSSLSDGERCAPSRRSAAGGLAPQGAVTDLW